MILTRRLYLEGADRAAQYKEAWRRGAARNMHSARCERDARLRHAEEAGVPYAMHDTERQRPLSGPLGLRGVGHGQNRGSIHRIKEDAPSFLWRRHGEHIREGFKYPRASACSADRTTTVRLDLGTSVPPTRLSELMTPAMLVCA